MFYSEHDLCDQIRPDDFTLIVQLVPFLLIPAPEVLQCIRIASAKSVVGISPTWVLLRFLFCTVNLGNVLVLPYTFAATDCCVKRNLTAQSCASCLLLVLQAGLVWLCNGISTILFLVYYIDRKPRILASSIGIIKLSSTTSTHPPWTPDRRTISILCLVGSAGLIPISVAYIVPLFPTTEAYWYSLEAWSFGLNIFTACLAVMQGLPQIRLAGTLCRLRWAGEMDRARAAAATGAPDEEERERGTKKDLGLRCAVFGSIRWAIMAAVWTTWFGARLYENINFYLPVLWVVGAQVYLNYLVVGLEDAMVAWVLWRDGRASSRGRPITPTLASERTPLLIGVRWHESGGQEL
ncbi:hypothetical protein DRE_00870 [Drechslerella stenobrocha 248]|uniref:Uncharacterized protein n=1 Tax=Drechslerella stenobrocha 248 TaxID=1043628 RepID=W7HN90_9PEZI|nr:hypothetical protein DRE_00870 [Drechslerella stenobrocha 248]